MIRRLVAGAGDRVAYLWGARGTGKTHLLEASCRELSKRGGRATLLPLAQQAEMTTDACDGLEALGLVCVDDVHLIAGDRAWEEAILYLYERAEQSGTRLLFATRPIPGAAGFSLPDLMSRLAQGLALRLQPLNDEMRRLVLQGRARNRGFEISDEVVAFLLHRYPRDMHTLFTLLDRVDQLTLSEKRPVTIPLMKRLLDGECLMSKRGDAGSVS